MLRLSKFLPNNKIPTACQILLKKPNNLSESHFYMSVFCLDADIVLQYAIGSFDDAGWHITDNGIIVCCH